MKKVLLTTTALVMTAGVASAEITFSGKGEAGVYRLAPTAATTGTAARAIIEAVTDVARDDANSENGGVELATTTTADTNEDIIGFIGGTLTTIARSGATSDTIVADATGANVHAGDVHAAQEAVNVAAAAVAAAESALALNAAADVRNGAANGAGGGNEAAGSAEVVDHNTTALAVARANLALAEAKLAALTGVAATGKGATPKLVSYSGYDFNVALAGASDNGMTFAMGFDMGAGHIADQDDDRAMDAQGGSIATDELTITYAGYTVGIGNDNIDDLYDDTQNGDVSLSGSLGDLTFSLVTDMDDDVKAVAASKVFTAESGVVGNANYVAATYVETAASAAVYNPTSYAIGYTMGNIAFSMAGTEHDDRGHAAAKMSLNYTVSDALSVKLESDNVGTYKDIAKVSVTSKISDALSITASVKDDKDHALNTNTGGKQSQDVSISYSAGALSSTLATDEGSNWWVNAQYDLGGGAQAFTTFDHTEFLVAGVNFKF